MTLTKVYLWPALSASQKGTGIGRIVHAQHRYLPGLGIKLVSDAREAHLCACHTQRGDAPRVDVLHCHGLYWDDVEHAPFSNWQASANLKIAEAAREAVAITVPSDWVAEPFRRDMRLEPTIIGHGVEPEEWDPLPNGGYLLWNKNRSADVCDPSPALAMAQRGHRVVTTFLPRASPPPPTVTVTGSVRWEHMRDLVRAADIYLATTFETFGVGTLEAMAAGVPILGYKWGGTAELVRHGVEGILVTPGDLDGLARAIEHIRMHRQEFSEACRQRAKDFRWEIVMEKYADLYRWVAAELAEQGPLTASIVIPSHDYAEFVGTAVASALEQTHAPKEIIVVDDASGDTTPAVIEGLQRDNPGRIRYLRNDKNQGVAFSRNRGVAEASSDLVACLDADDHLDPRYLEILLPAFVKDRSLGVAYTGLDVELENGRISRTAWPPEFSWEAQAAMPEAPRISPSNCIGSAAMFRKEMWRRSGGYKQQYAPGEDAEFWTRGLACGFTAKRVTDLALFHYHVHHRSASRTKKYVATSDHAPWMRDRQYPFAAPVSGLLPIVRSYAQPLITVVIRAGKGSMADTLDDLLGQTFRGWEVIAEGGLRGESWAVPYPFLRWAGIHSWQNMARGCWIHVLRAGDTLKPDTLGELLEGELAFEGHLASSGINGRRLLQENRAMSGCCGGDSKAVLRAKRIIGQLNAIEAINLAGTIRTGDGHMRLEYIGERIGAVTFHGKTGRIYRGGNNAIHKFAEVDPDDVPKLVSTGEWRPVLSAPLPVAPVQALPPAPPVPEAEVKAAEPVAEPAAVREPTAEAAPVAPKPRAKPGPKPGAKRKASA